MRKLSIAVLATGLAAMFALAGCGGGGGGGTKNPPPPANGMTSVTGTVKDNRGRTVQNVAVSLGAMQTVTDPAGRFKFDVGLNATAASLFTNPGDPTQTVVKVSTRLLSTDYPQVPVTYLGLVYEQIPANGGASVPIPFEVLWASGVAKDMGTITVQYNDPANPPGPPF